MSFNVANVGGSMTGGSTVALTSAGFTQSGKASFTTPDSSRLTPQNVYFKVTNGDPGNASNPGTGRTHIQIAFGSRTTPEGCCTPVAGFITFDLEVRWPLQLDIALVEEAYALFQALMFSQQTEDAIKLGVTPA